MVLTSDSSSSCGLICFKNGVVFMAALSVCKRPKDTVSVYIQLSPLKKTHCTEIIQCVRRLLPFLVHIVNELFADKCL